MDLKIGDIVYVVQNFGISVRFLKGEILKTDSKAEQITIAILNKDRKPFSFYIFQHNITILKNKTEARLVFLAKLCRKKDLQNDWEQVFQTIKDNTGLTDEKRIKEEIKMSQSQFPELWI